MMRKTSLILLGATAGVAVTLIATQPRILFEGARAQAAAADTYRQLSLFGDVFERVRSVARSFEGKLPLSQVDTGAHGPLAEALDLLRPHLACIPRARLPYRTLARLREQVLGQ
jgi:hypothetical protein